MTLDEEAFHGTLLLNGTLTPARAQPAGTKFLRGSIWPDGDWEPAPPERRKGRCDPPPGHEHEFSVLYLGDYETTIEFEMQRLALQRSKRGEKLVRPYQPGRKALVTAHTLKVPAAFVDMDSPQLAMTYPSRAKGTDEILAWQWLALAVYRNVRAHEGVLVVPVVGLTYRSRQRGCNGQVFALFGDCRDDVLQRGTPRKFTADG